MPIGEAQATGRESIDIRCWNQFGAIGTDVRIADIIAIDDNHVGLDCEGGCGEEKQEYQKVRHGARLWMMSGSRSYLP